MPTDELDSLQRRVTDCRRCPRLVQWRERVADEPRPAYAGSSYWCRPVPGFGDPAATLLVCGLAPAAHGANRTGRMFTGDRSGDFLYAALHRAGLASQPVSSHRGDGLRLTGCWITAAVRCAPPGNRPTPGERDNCAPYLAAELSLLPVQVVLALGGFAWDAALRVLGARVGPIRPRPRFAHGTEARVGEFTVLGSYHVSQQNTFTGRLTAGMLDAVVRRARDLSR
ncbi:MAG: uracil-DNA glycosylase [Actinomycetota bacterium]|nr:uracil-DNA glycosylase [Actinomycetota bacterium]